MKREETKQNKGFFALNLGVILMLIALALSNVVFAQPGGGGQQGPPQPPTTKQIKKMVSELADEISLNEEQEALVLDMFIEHFEEVEDLMDGGRPDRDEMEALETKFEKQVCEVLTEEQQEQFLEYQEEQKGQRGPGGGQGGQRN